MNNNKPRGILVPKRSWIQRNPRAFSIIFITTSMLVFFSRPIYDAFIRTDLVPAKSGESKRF